MEFEWSKEDEAFRDEVRRALLELPATWIRRPSSLGSSQDSPATREFSRVLAARGLLAPHWPVEFGGRGATAWQQYILGSEMWAQGEPRGPQYMNVNWIGPCLLDQGTEEQRELFLPLIARGDIVWCQGFSEPDAGSDLSALRTSARKDGHEYVIDGQKIWTSYASDASYCFLLARTERAANPRQGITIFLVPMTAPGLVVRRIPAVIGDHAFHELTFDAVRVDESLRLGGEGEGWNIVRGALSLERVGNPRYIRAQKVLDELIESASADGQGAQAVLDVSPEDLGLALAFSEAARILSLRVVDDRVKQRSVGSSASAARVAVVMAERATADACCDAAGIGSLVEGAVADGQFRNSLAAGIASGTYEVQLNAVAAAVLAKAPS